MIDGQVSTGIGFKPTVDVRRGAELRQRFGSVYSFQCIDKDGNERWSFDIHNRVVNEGLDDIINKYLNATAYSATHYVGLIDNVNFSFVRAADTASRITSTGGSTGGAANAWEEATEYTETNRVAFVPGAVSSQSISNTASVAAFSINATKTIRGAFLITSSGKAATSGILFGAAAFSTGGRAVESGDTLNVTVTVTASTG